MARDDRESSQKLQRIQDRAPFAPGEEVHALPDVIGIRNEHEVEFGGLCEGGHACKVLERNTRHRLGVRVPPSCHMAAIRFDEQPELHPNYPALQGCEAGNIVCRCGVGGVNWPSQPKAVPFHPIRQELDLSKCITMSSLLRFRNSAFVNAIVSVCDV